MNNINKHIILFDGVCNLCNGIVKFIIKRDKNRLFQFASLQSDAGKSLLQKFNQPTNTFHSFVYIKNDKCLTKSSAALAIAKELKGLWPLFYGLVIVPKFIRDAVYDLIAKNRYRLFGRSESCMIPTPELKDLFLDA